MSLERTLVFAKACELGLEVLLERAAELLVSALHDVRHALDAAAESP
jgi:hypothetical protein